nr:reverse transcriptase domain-containing protein [Tanacetum cinerariifolium]
MSTHSSARNLFPPLDNLELTIRRRSRVDPTLLNDFEMATDENGDPSVPDLRTMEELCQPTLNGRGGPIASIAIQATNFGLKNDMIQQVHNSCQFHGILDTIYNGLTLRHRDTINAAAGGTFMKRRPEECYDLIENMTAHHKDWDTSAQRTTVGQTQNVYATGAYNQGGNAYQPQGNRNLLSYRSNNYLKPPGFNQNQNRNNQNQNFQNQNRNQGNNHPQRNNQGRKQFFQGASHGQNLPLAYQAPLIKPRGTLPSNTITNPKEDLKGITTRSGNAYKGPTIPTTSSSLPKVVELVQVKTPILNSEPVVAPVIKPVVAPVSAPKPNQKLSIPYPSRLHDQKLRDKAIEQKEKFFQIFQDLNFNISFADALILMPKFGPTIKSLLTNKDKLFELARTPLNEHCSAVLLKKLPEKLGDPDKFLIPCDFSGMNECLALADLGASINLMPLSVWNKLSLPELSPTCMTLELADRSISRSVRVAEDVF